MRSILTVAVLAFGLVGCAGTVNGDAAQAVAASEEALTTAEKLALVYEQSPSPNPAIVAKIKAADTTAYNAVKAAEAGTGALAAATAAIDAFVALIPSKG